MALGDVYASGVELETRLGRVDDGTFVNVLAAASREVEQFTHRQFNKVTVASARTFRPIDECLAIVDDLYDTTGLIIATDDDNDGTFETTWSASWYELAPLDGVVSGAPGWPYWMIKPVGGHYFRAWNRSNLRVTALWGWTTVPAAIKEATLAVAESTASKSPGKTRSIAVDGYSESYKVDDESDGPVAAAAPYQRFEGFA